MTLISTLTTPATATETASKPLIGQCLIDISRLPIDQLFIEWEKFRVEFFSILQEDDYPMYDASAIDTSLELFEEELRGRILMYSDRMTYGRFRWITDALAHLYRRLQVKAIDDQLAALPHVDECVWYRDQYYGGIGPFIDACVESGDDFWASVEGAKPIPFKFIEAHNLAKSCWRHMTEQTEDSDRITAEELFDEAVMDYQHLAEFEFEIKPKGLEELAEAIKTYCFVNAAKWREQYEDIAGASSRTPYPASKREEHVLSRLPETSSFTVLMNALVAVEALYKDDERLLEESGQVVGLTEEWWIAQGWKRGEV
jgi:hypothetical protein